MTFEPKNDRDKKNRLSPPLMHVFRGAARQNARRGPDGGRVTLAKPAGASPDGASKRAVGKPQRAPISEGELREEVKSDVEKLLNAVSMDSTVDMTGFPDARKSIVNYGLPDIAHRTIDELKASDLDDEIQAILRCYEPRLVSRTVRVDRDTTADASILQIRYVIHADLSCHPLDIPIEFLADVDVATGKIQINRR